MLNIQAARPVPAADAGPSMAAAASTVRIWDAPVRVSHWLMVLCFTGAWLTAESEHWRLVHVTLGYTMAGLLVFRLLWGLVGTRHARFASFVRGPRAAWSYLAALLRGRAERHAGHNPAGALAIVGLLALAALTTASGWATEAGIAGDLFEELHEGLAKAWLVLVVVHVLGVVVGSLAHRENLVAAMFTGRKPARPDEAVPQAWRSLAAVMVLAVAAFWAWQWYSAPQGGMSDPSSASGPAASSFVEGGPGAAADGKAVARRESREARSRRHRDRHRDHD